MPKTGRVFLTSSAQLAARDIAKRIGRRGLRLAFISTAAEPEKGPLDWLGKDRNALKRAGFAVADYTITGKTRNEIRPDLAKFDVIFFSGGNTFYLLEKIQQSKSAGVIRSLVKKGKIYIGSSAGSVVAGPDIYPIKDLDNFKAAPDIKGYKGLGLVDFVVFPHWGGKRFKERYLGLRLRRAYNTRHKIILLTDHQYIEAKGGKFKIIEVRH